MVGAGSMAIRKKAEAVLQDEQHGVGALMMMRMRRSPEGCASAISGEPENRGSRRRGRRGRRSRSRRRRRGRIRVRVRVRVRAGRARHGFDLEGSGAEIAAFEFLLCFVLAFVFAKKLFSF
jgi:hypothetical protein